MAMRLRSVVRSGCFAEPNKPYYESRGVFLQLEDIFGGGISPPTVNCCWQCNSAVAVNRAST